MPTFDKLGHKMTQKLLHKLLAHYAVLILRPNIGVTKVYTEKCLKVLVSSCHKLVIKFLQQKEI